MTGRRRCSYCPADMGPSGTELDSHGVCPQCWDHARATLGLPPKPYPETAQEWAERALVDHGASGCDPCAMEAETVIGRGEKA